MGEQPSQKVMRARLHARCINVEEGNYYRCLCCSGQTVPGEPQAREQITHAPWCIWTRIAALEKEIPVKGVSRLVSERLYEAMADAPRLARIEALHSAGRVVCTKCNRAIVVLIDQHEEPSKPGEGSGECQQKQN